MPSSRRSSRSINPLQRQPAWRAQPKNSAPTSVSLVVAEPEQGAPLAPASQVIISTQLETLSIHSNENASTSPSRIASKRSLSSIRGPHSRVIELEEAGQHSTVIEVEEAEQTPASQEPITPQNEAISIPVEADIGPHETVHASGTTNSVLNHPTGPIFSPLDPSSTRRSWFSGLRPATRGKDQGLSKLGVVHKSIDSGPQSGAAVASRQTNDSSTSLPTKFLDHALPPIASPPLSRATTQGLVNVSGPSSSSVSSSTSDQVTALQSIISPPTPSRPPSPSSSRAANNNHPTQGPQVSLPSSLDEEVPPVVDLTLTLPPAPCTIVPNLPENETGGKSSTLNVSSSRFALTVPFFGRAKVMTESEVKKMSDSAGERLPITRKTEIHKGSTDLSTLPQSVTIESQMETIFADAAQDSLQNAMAHSVGEEMMESPRPIPTSPISDSNIQSHPETSIARETGDQSHAPSQDSPPAAPTRHTRTATNETGTGWWSYLNTWSTSTPASTSTATPVASTAVNDSSTNPASSSIEKCEVQVQEPSMSDLQSLSHTSGSRQSDSRCKDNKPNGEHGSQDPHTVTRGGTMVIQKLHSAPNLPPTPIPANSSHAHKAHNNASSPLTTTGNSTARGSKSLTPTPSKASAEPSHASDITIKGDRAADAGESTKPTNPDGNNGVSNTSGLGRVSQLQEGEQLEGSAEAKMEGRLEPDPTTNPTTSTASTTAATSWFSPWAWYSTSQAEAGGGVGPSVSTAIANDNEHDKQNGDHHQHSAAVEDAAALNNREKIANSDPAGRKESREREAEGVGSQGEASDGRGRSEDQAQGDAYSSTAPEQDTSKSNSELETRHATTHDTNMTLNPVEQSITSSAYRSGWVSFFSSRKMMAKTLGYGGGGLIEEGSVKRDEHGAEVMDVDFDDDAAGSDESGKDQKGARISDGVRSSAIDGKMLTEEGKDGKSGTNAKTDTRTSSPSPSRNQTQSTAPPLTTSESVRQETVQSNPANNKDVKSQSTPCSKAASGTSTPTASNGKHLIPTGKVPSTPDLPDPSAKSLSPSSSPPTSAATQANTSTTTSNKRTASPAPSTKSIKKEKAPAPPNLVLPTWEDTFHVPPRSIITHSLDEKENGDRRIAHGYTASGGKLLGRAMGFVSGVLFSTPTTPGTGNKPDNESVGADVDKNMKEEEHLSPYLTERKEKFRYFGKELPRAWDVLDGQTSVKASTSTTYLDGSVLGPPDAQSSTRSPSKVSTARHTPWRFMAAMERDKEPMNTVAGTQLQSEVRDVLRGCRRVVVIGVHGWFPGAVVRTVLGEPTGTSSKFVNMMVQALENFQEEHGVSLDKITGMPLEGEGTIDRRVDKLYTSLTSNKEWLDDLRAADAIFVATHSQGSVVSTHLLNRLIHDQHIRTSRNTSIVGSPAPSFAEETGIPITSVPKPQKVCCLALCGIHLGPLRYLSSSSFVQPYLQYFESSAARELFEFQNTESAVSKAYVNALRHVLDNGVKMVYVASLNDQVVPIYSGLFTAISHPLILRALYIDGDAYHSSDFLSNLLVLLLRILNSGISDSGLLEHLSEATAGSLNGVGHSTAYEELATYTLAVKYLFLTNDGHADHPKAALEPFNAGHERNDYEIPWSLRDVIADERVLHFFSREIAELRDAFRDWHPKTTILRDLKRKLQPIQKLPSTFYSGNSASKL